MTITTDTKSIANAFNDFFSNIGNRLAKSIPEELIYLPVPPSSSFYLSFVTSSEIEDEINNIKSWKATGPFSIPTKLLKLLKHVFKPLEMLFKSACLYFSRYRGMASDYQNSDILPKRHLWGTIFENIIKSFQKLLVFEKFGKNEKTGFA